jgi:hypothetical protein
VGGVHIENINQGRRREFCSLALDVLLRTPPAVDRAIMESGWFAVINWIILLQVFTFSVTAEPAPRILAKAVSSINWDKM